MPGRASARGYPARPVQHGSWVTPRLSRTLGERPLTKAIALRRVVCLQNSALPPPMWRTLRCSRKGRHEPARKAARQGPLSALRRPPPCRHHRTLLRWDAEVPGPLFCFRVLWARVVVVSHPAMVHQLLRGTPGVRARLPVAGVAKAAAWLGCAGKLFFAGRLQLGWEDPFEGQQGIPWCHARPPEGACTAEA